MSSESDDVAKLEVAHILFADIVGFSKLSMEEQKKAIRHLGSLVRETECFRNASADNLISLTTGDGFALVFFDDPEAPIKCARELGRQLLTDPRVKLRMGIHSGAVYRISNINQRSDVTGGGINLAQRVMDCGDAGHILASGAVANILGGVEAWAGDFHDLDRAEIKGGDRIRVFNVYAQDYGNPETPGRLRQIHSVPNAEVEPGVSRRRFGVPAALTRRPMLAGIVAVAMIAVAVVAVLLLSGSQYRSLAVVPFDYESSEAAYLADDLPDRVSSSLSDLQNKLSVKRSNERVYKYTPPSNIQELGRSLGAQVLLRGNLRKDGDMIVVDVHLMDVDNGKELWTKQYSKQLAEVSSVEQDIAQAITERLSIRLTAEEKESLRSGPSKDPEANKLYEAGLSSWATRTDKSLADATQQFQAAIQKDPNFARAFSKLADTLVLRNVSTPDAKQMKEAEDAANTALKLKPRLADAHISLAYINFRYRWNWTRAEEEFKRALELDDSNPQAHDWYADFLEAMGRSGEAVKQMERAVELDRKTVWINADLGLAYCYADQFEAAINQLNKTLSLANKGEDLAQTHNYLGLTYERKGMLDQALAEYVEAHNRQSDNRRLEAILAHGYAITGQKEKAYGALNSLAQTNVSSYYLALGYAALPTQESKDRAFSLLYAARDKREPALPFLKIDPRFNQTFRQDSRFNDILSGVKLR
jgi:adenylate cyclase